MPCFNFRPIPRVVPLKVHRGQGRLLRSCLWPRHLPHTLAVLSYQAEPFCLLHVYHGFSVYLLDTVQTLLTYLYCETESSKIFSNTHMGLVFCKPYFISGGMGATFLRPIKSIILGPTHTYFTLKTKAVSSLIR